MPICKSDPLRVDSKGLAWKGSMLQMQLYANLYPHTISQAIGAELELTGSMDWMSPREEDRYAEYRDESFLKALGLSRLAGDLRDFWPRGGPCWDALGLWTTSEGEKAPVLIEAKSYPGEAVSSMSAKAAASRETIERSLAMTAKWLGIEGGLDSWTAGSYQAANRLAHLYFLREICQVPAYLVFVLFTDDPLHQPTSHDVWSTSLPHFWTNLGLEGIPNYTAAILLPGLERPIPRPTR